MGDQKIGYINKLSTVKRILKKMAEMEDSFSFLENSDSCRWWELGPVEIEIDAIENDTYYLTVAVSPKIERKRGRAKSCINYFYKIKGKQIERDMLPTLDLPAFKDKGKKVLDELVSILNSGNLVLKKNKNAP